MAPRGQRANFTSRVAPSLIEKYQQILSADPRSRIFVELARALLEQGDCARAAEVCRAGLINHPASIQGRVILGRALHDSGDAAAAREQFDQAIAIDPGNPYAYNLVGEGLLRSGAFKESVPFLRRAAELQPADVRVREALAEASQRLERGETAPALAPPRAEAPATSAAPPAPVAPAARAPSAAPPAAPRAMAPPMPAPPPASPAAPPDPDAEHSGPILTALPPLELPGPEPGPQPDDHPPEDRTLLLGQADLAAPPPRRPSSMAPPVLRPATPPAGRAAAPTILGLIPTIKVEVAERGVALAAPAVDAAEAARIAADYERSLRARVAQEEAAAPAPPRHRRTIVAVAVAAVVAVSAGSAYLWVQDRTRTEAGARAVEAGRVGLARDTKASLAKAAEVLAGVRERMPGDPALRGQVLSLAAQVAAVRALDFGDAEARSDAVLLGEEPAAGDGALVARALLADAPADRRAAEEAVLGARAGETPLLQLLAGRLLLKKGEVESGRGRLRLGAQARPPLLAALADLGESYLEAGDAEAALPYFEAALSAQPSHPRAAVGAAEARLALERPLEGSLKELQAVEKDPGSAPPVALRLRFQLVTARVEAALGDAVGASRRLTLAAGALGDSSGLQSARAELLLQARAFSEAEEAAARAVRLDATAPGPQVLLARARLGLHRPAAALQALQHKDDRAVWLMRAEALLAAGQPAQARSALERTVRNGKLSTEAAAHYALSELALGRADVALGLLDKLASTKGASALVHAAHGRALLAAKRPEDAEVACRAAAERAPKDTAGPLCLGRVRLAQGRAAEAVEPLLVARALDAADPEIPKLLAQARAPARAVRPAPAPVRPVAAPPRRK